MCPPPKARSGRRGGAMTDVVIVDSGVANLASIASAFRRLDATVVVTGDEGVVQDAPRVVLPGVGAFGAGLGALRARRLDQAVTQAAARGTPLLGVCLGMQMLCEASEEAPGVHGLGVIPGICRCLPSDVRVPHLGWNAVTAAGEGLVATGVAAFANSYALREAPAGWVPAWTTHGVRFVAALEQSGERLLACQFHPELSGAYGAALLERWLTGRAVAPVADTIAAASAGLRRRLIPCLDVQDGRVVKGVRFQNLRDAGDPAAQAARYEAQGADEIVILDIVASAAGRATQVETVRAVRAAIRIPLTVGGGVRSVADARQLLSAGADKVSVNTAAVRRPTLLTELAQAFGCQCVVLAIDARRIGGDERWEVLVRGGRDTALHDAIAWAREGERLGAGEILLTSWDRDGTRTGHDVELLRAVADAVRLLVIASGGVGTRVHVAAAFAAGADAVLAASVFHDGDDTVSGIKADLAVRGIRVRQ